MLKKKVMVKNDHGLHARVAMKVAEKTRNSSSKVTIYKGPLKADASSLLELLMLGAAQGTEIEISVSGGEEEKSMKEMEIIFEAGAGI
jgi:phosphotransferase system HPr (HPr) family protein